MAGAIVLAWIGSTVAGWWIGRTKGREQLGVLLGLILGLLGVVVIALLPDASVPERASARATSRYWDPLPDEPLDRLKVQWETGRITEMEYLRRAEQLRREQKPS
ncbi:MAG: hypothetical protein QOJ19_2323 [Acidimicrobiia bacterium]|jgi:uncharacterized membrane protein|nr:hypothetical protein [Acidimicrobiia bacterium]